MRILVVVAVLSWRFATATRPIPIHYFFVNRTDYREGRCPASLEALVRRYRREADRAKVAVTIDVYDYARARDVVASVDEKLLFFWDRINLTYATILSNIFRYAMLFSRGGVYHDAKMGLSGEGLAELARYLAKYDMVFEENPSPHLLKSKSRKLRNTNMAAATPSLNYFATCLSEMRRKLEALHAAPPAPERSRKAVFDLDSHTAIERLARSRGAASKHHMLLAYRCRGQRPTPPNCTDDADVSGFVDGESYVGRKWRGLEHVPEIAAAYNARSHWSEAQEPIFDAAPRPPPRGGDRPARAKATGVGRLFDILHRIEDLATPSRA